jgi:hypothetical protein
VIDNSMKTLKLALFGIILFGGFMLFVVGCLQRNLLYFPTHEFSAKHASEYGLTPWLVDGEYTGHARLVDNPGRVWLFIHGNGGQAATRSYIFHCFSPLDSIYILEYPGYGDRPGKPSKVSFDGAALKAYTSLVSVYGASKICVLGESLGSGPASFLATVDKPPFRIALVVPFDVLKDVAQKKFPYLPVGLIMRDQWNNIESLKSYKGRIDIYGAKYDNVIPVEHARNLARSIAGSHYHEIEGDHGWANGSQVDLSK